MVKQPLLLGIALLDVLLQHLLKVLHKLAMNLKVYESMAEIRFAVCKLQKELTLS